MRVARAQLFQRLKRCAAGSGYVGNDHGRRRTLGRLKPGGAVRGSDDLVAGVLESVLESFGILAIAIDDENGGLHQIEFSIPDRTLSDVLWQCFNSWSGTESFGLAKGAGY